MSVTTKKMPLQGYDEAKDGDIDEHQEKKLNEFKEIMDRQAFTTKHIHDFPNEATRIFYQLPLDDKQREELYKVLMAKEQKCGPLDDVPE